MTVPPYAAIAGEPVIAAQKKRLPDNKKRENIRIYAAHPPARQMFFMAVYSGFLFVLTVAVLE